MTQTSKQEVLEWLHAWAPEKSQLKATPGLITSARCLHRTAGLVCACTALAGGEEVMHTEAAWKEMLPRSLIGYGTPLSRHINPNAAIIDRRREEPGRDVSTGRDTSGQGYVSPGPLRFGL